jgi:hypothetical protein
MKNETVLSLVALLVIAAAVFAACYITVNAPLL